MCGIFGFLGHRGEHRPEDYRLRESAQLLNHRGPDNFGVYADVNIGLAHTRLSLLDLSPRSNQPFWDKQGRYCLVYNGEIYNFKELRTELERKGIIFRSTSDTEVLLEWIINCGVEATLPKLEGMFAFGLYDKHEKTLIVARDRFGIKPLFIYDEDDAFIFSSEIKAMSPWINFEPDLLSISSYLFGYSGPSKGHCFFNKVKILPPGTLVNIRMGDSARYSRFISLNDFWDPDQASRLKELKPKQLVDEVEELLLKSVQKQLFADAPVGALCSGGVDSSLVMAMAAKFHNNLAIFHANVEGPLSEYEAAANLARHLKLDLKTAVVKDQDFIDQIPEVIDHFGHPFDIIPSSVPFLSVSKTVRGNGVKAVLSGEGSDECFLGYNFLVPDLLKWKRRPMPVAKQVLRTVMELFKNGRGKTSKTPVFIMGFSPYTSVAYHSYAPPRPPLPELAMGLLNRFEVGLETEELRIHIQNHSGNNSTEGYLRSLDLLHYNLRVLLHRNDTMGMAASIESRFPFLDTELVKLAVNLPYNLKIRFTPTAIDNNHYFYKDKWILRQVADRYLPKTLSRRSKGAFPVDAFKRLKFSSGYFENSLIVDLFKLTPREVTYLFDNADLGLRLKLMQLDCWSHVCLFQLPTQHLFSRLNDYIKVIPFDAN